MIDRGMYDNCVREREKLQKRVKELEAELAREEKGKLNCPFCNCNDIKNCICEDAGCMQCCGDKCLGEEEKG